MQNDSPVGDHAEKAVIDEFSHSVRDGDVIWDIGAMSGSYSRYARVACDPDEIHAFEPSPLVFPQLQKSLNELPNGCERKAHQVALGFEEDTVYFAVEMPANSPTSAGAIVDESNLDEFDPEHIIDVPVMAGDSLIERDGGSVPDVLKIDVEGAEMEVLRGLEETIRANPPRSIFCEIHLPTDAPSPSIYDFDSEPSDVHEFLSHNGYSVTEINRRERDYHIVARQ